MEFPTTPIKRNAKIGIRPLSVVHSPPILKSDSEVNNEETPDEGVSNIEGYPHGLSTKKKVAAHEVIETIKSDEYTIDYDMSIEIGRNNSDVKSDTKESPNHGSTPKEKNIPKIIENNEESNSHTNSFNDPFLNKREHETTLDNESSLKRIKLNNVPDLHQDNSNVVNPENPNGMDTNIQSPELVSPIRIEMLESNDINSPSAHLDEANKSKDANEEIDVTSHSSNHESLNGPYDNSHMLTPIAHQSISNYDDFDANVDIDSISKRNDELNSQIFSLNQRINSMHVVHDKLKVELKQLQFDNNLIKDEKLKLQEQIDTRHNELKEENEHIKKEISELHSELSSLQSNQTLLQEKYDQIYNENIKLQNAKDMLSNEVETLQKSLSESADILEDLTAHNKDLEEKLNQTTASKQAIENERNELNKELRRIMAQLDGKDNEITTLEDKIKGLIENERNHSRDLIDQVANLNNDKMNLEETLKKSENSHKTETQYLQDTIEEKEKQLVDIKDQLTKISNEKEMIEGELEKKTDELNTLKKTYDETNDNATIRTAEVAELNDEIESLKDSKSQLETNISRLEEQIQEWKLKYQHEIEEKQKLYMELESLQEKNQKANDSTKDTSNTINLEAYQQIQKENEILKGKLENQSISLDSSDSTLKKYKDQIEILKRKADQREADFGKRLKKLSEDLYIQYSSKHEQKVAALKANYDDRYKATFDRLKNENTALQQEVEQLNGKLALERREKQELIKALDK